MTTFQESIELKVPRTVAYAQWARFEEFPRFMTDVAEVRRLDDRHLHWRVTMAGIEEEWDAEITEAVPNERIAWRSTSGAANAGAVTFQELSDGSTRLHLWLQYDPKRWVESAGDILGIPRRHIEADLQSFKQCVEEGVTQQPRLPNEDELVGQ